VCGKLRRDQRNFHRYKKHRENCCTALPVRVNRETVSFPFSRDRERREVRISRANLECDLRIFSPTRKKEKQCQDCRDVCGTHRSRTEGQGLVDEG